MDQINFTNCPVVLKGYGGANGNKKAVLYNNDVYMLKFPPVARRSRVLSYTNSCISEYVSCRIIETLGIPVQEVLLGTYQVNGKEKVIVACKDFAYPNASVNDFAFIKNTMLHSSENGYGTDLEDMLYVIQTQTFLDKKVVLKRFWDMFIIDALLGNFDRHNGNWGYLQNHITNELSLAPIYDCGSCLFPQLTDEQMEAILKNEEELNLRVYERPQSTFSIDNIRINFFTYLSTTDNPECLASLKNITEKIDLDKINTIVNETPYISEIHKKFLMTVIQYRKEKILDYAMQHNPNLVIEQNYEMSL